MSLAADHLQPADLSACKVLVVDDSLPIRTVIGAYLLMASIHRVEYAADGLEALARLEGFAPDLIILDIMMPKMDGFELCRRLRADARWRHVPVLVQTALETPSERTSVFRAGATDLITKPIHGPELIARVRVHLENRLLIGSLENYRAGMELELELARQMQSDLLPEDGVIGTVAGATGLRLQSHFQPSAELGGDMWTVQDLGDGKVGVALVDFSGHGVTAALNTFRLHTLMHQLPSPDPRHPAAYLTVLNDHLAALLPVHQFATMFYGVVDTRLGMMTYAGAGAPSPLLGNAEGEITVLDASGLPLGIVRGACYGDQRVAFSEGDFLLLYSDALVETPDQTGAMLETEDLIAMIGQSLSGQQPLATLLGRFREGRQPLKDDLTLVWLTREPWAQ